MDEKELRNPANWLMDEPVAYEPVKSPRSVVSVSFSHDDLAAVARAAKESGMKTSEFIRTAALSEANRRHRGSFEAFAGGASQGVLTVLATNWRRGSRSRVVLRRSAGE